MKPKVQSEANKRSMEPTANDDRRFQSLVQSLPDAVVVHVDDEIVFVNSAALRLIQATSTSQILGRSIYDFVPEDAVAAVRSKIETLPAQPDPAHPLEHKLIALDGSLRDVEAIAIQTTWEGRPAVEVVLRDISGRKEAEHSVQEWIKRFELTHKSGLKIGLWKWDLDTNTVEWSDETRRQFGISRKRFSGSIDEVMARIHHDDIQGVRIAIRKSIAESSDFAAQYRVVRSDKSISWFDTRGTIVSNGTKKMIGIQIDITDIKKNEESLLESKQNYLSLLNSTAEGIFGIDLDGNCTFCNPAAARMFGYEDPSQLVGELVHDKHHYLHPDGSPYANTDCHICRGFRHGTGTHCDYECFIRVGGSKFPVEYWSYPILRNGVVTGCVVTFLDITVKRRAQEDLLRSEEHYRLMFDQNPQPMWVFERPSLRFLAVNQAAIEHYGYSREEFLSMTIGDIRPEEDIPKLRKIAEQPLDSTARDSGVWRHRTKDGRIIFVEVSGRVLQLPGGDAELILATDVTDRLRAEDALLASEEKHREFMENAPFGLYRCTPEGKFLDVNPALVSMLGYSSKNDLMRCNIGTEIYSIPAEREAIIARHAHESRIIGVVAKWKRKDDEVITVRLSGKRVQKEGQTSHYEVIVEDITEQCQLEEQFRQAQKMEAIGRLAGGVAHDFNNALAVITGYSEVLQLKLSHDEILHRHAGEILKAGMKAASLTHQLLAFSRKQTLRPRVLDLSNVVRDVDKMLRRLIGENIDLVHVHAPDLAKVTADPSQLEQVVMNLAVNARDAMPHGGKLRIETANALIDDALARRFTYLRPGKFVVLRVSDTGCGMDEKTMSKVFEPFFTTKSAGKGTGLGLSTVYGIVKQSGGYITVESEINRGTRFDIYFPATNQAVEVAQSSSPEIAIPQGSETVLVVEDETSLRDLIVSSLMANGYTVLMANSSESAIAIAKSESRIHLLLTDVILPGMNGPDLASSLQSSHPEIKTIFMSGYTDELLGEHGMLSPGIVLLGKPFSTKTLLAKLREVLDT